MRTCTKCGKKKKESEFGRFCVTNKRNGNVYSGLYGSCKTCDREYQLNRSRKKGVKPRNKRGVSEVGSHISCSKCKQTRPISDFRTRTDKKSGKDYYNSTCKKCDVENARCYYENHKDDPEFKKKNVERTKAYADKNFEQIRIRKDNPQYKKKKSEWESGRYHRKKDQIAAKMKIKRQTPEYKAKMKAYREKRKEIIYQQELVTKKRYHEKNRDGITDKYCISRLMQQGREITPENIEIKRGEILLERVSKKVKSLQKPTGILKVCTNCKEEKDEIDFYPSKRRTGKIGRAAWCKKCSNKKSEEYRNKKKNESKGSGEDDTKGQDSRT